MSKILVLAYTISPFRGSEYSVAWNYVTHMSKDNELVVLYGISDDHLGDIQTMEKWLQENELPNVRFIAVKPNRWANLLNIPNRRDVFVYTFYWAYKVWHMQVYQVVKELLKKEDFDLIHYVGMIGYREPGYLWKFSLPYVWGPIGGFNNVPTQMIRALPLGGKIKLGLRALLNNIQMYTNSRVHRAVKRADVLMTCSGVNHDTVLRIYGRDTICMPENCITEVPGLVNPEKFNDEKLKLIWIGSVDARKSLIILLNALQQLQDHSNIELYVVGDGPLRESLTQYCQENGLDTIVKWSGAVSRKEVKDLLAMAHLHVITSVSEGNPTTIWESMSVGVPTLTVDHCGMHDVICERCGIKVPITNYEGIVAGFSTAIADLIVHREKLQILAEGTVECAQNYTWDKRRDFLNELYKSVRKTREEKME